MKIFKNATYPLVGMLVALSACSGPAPDAGSSANASADLVHSASGSDAVGSKDVSASDTFVTFVDDSGQMTLPRNVASEWNHLGSFAVVNEGTQDGNGLHHVYTTQDVVDHFRATGEFKDGAVLLKDVTGAGRASMTTGRSHWATDTAVWFMMVKDAEGRFEGNPLWGDGWGWALFKGDDLDTQVATDYKSDCITCHIPVEDRDWIHTFAYPQINGGDSSFTMPGDSSAPAETESSEPAAASEEQAQQAEDTVVVAMGSTGDPVAGKSKFGRCASCHSVVPGQNGLGPSLAGVVGRKAGSAVGFNYSQAMASSDVVWSAETLDSHLSDVRGFIPGNRMGQVWPVGVQDAQDRADIIAYLTEVSPQ